jgi:hypothetical protein
MYFYQRKKNRIDLIDVFIQIFNVRRDATKGNARDAPYRTTRPDLAEATLPYPLFYTVAPLIQPWPFIGRADGFSRISCFAGSSHIACGAMTNSD